MVSSKAKPTSKRKRKTKAEIAKNCRKLSEFFTIEGRNHTSAPMSKSKSHKKTVTTKKIRTRTPKGERRSKSKSKKLGDVREPIGTKPAIDKNQKLITDFFTFSTLQKLQTEEILVEKMSQLSQETPPPIVRVSQSQQEEESIRAMMYDYDLTDFDIHEMYSFNNSMLHLEQKMYQTTYPVLKEGSGNISVEYSMLKPQTKYGSPYTVVLDLDETLIHTTDTLDTNVMCDHEYEELFIAGETYYTFFRPQAREFVRNLARDFEVVIFTAGTDEYADKVAAMLDARWHVKREESMFSAVLSRSQCTEVKVDRDSAVFVKHLDYLGRNLDRVVMVDNTINALSWNIDNLVLCGPFYPTPHCVNDRTLGRIYSYLSKLRRCGNFRSAIRKDFKMEDRIINHCENCMDDEADSD
ncbi:hypothetical protein PCE1_003395 [Barthelona sp. PCE]